MSIQDDSSELREAATRKSRGSRFAAQVGDFKKKALTNTAKVHRGVSLRLFKAVILDTPVDTGRLRANWQCSLNVPLATESTSTDPSGSAAINQCAGRIKHAKPSDAIILTNSLPYVARIEYDGWSHTKAPKGMVRINVIRFKELLGEEVALTHTRTS